MGGIVGGTSYSGDRVMAMVNSGEAILTKQQQMRFLDIANGKSTGSGIDYELLGATMADAVSKQPAPVMVYKEFENFQRNVATIKEIATL